MVLIRNSSHLVDRSKYNQARAELAEKRKLELAQKAREELRQKEEYAKARLANVQAVGPSGTPGTAGAQGRTDQSTGSASIAAPTGGPVPAVRKLDQRPAGAASGTRDLASQRKATNASNGFPRNPAARITAGFSQRPVDPRSIAPPRQNVLPPTGPCAQQPTSPSTGSRSQQPTSPPTGPRAQHLISPPTGPRAQQHTSPPTGPRAHSSIHPPTGPRALQPTLPPKPPPTLQSHQPTPTQGGIPVSPRYSRPDFNRTKAEESVRRPGDNFPSTQILQGENAASRSNNQATGSTLNPTANALIPGNHDVRHTHSVPQDTSTPSTSAVPTPIGPGISRLNSQGGIQKPQETSRVVPQTEAQSNERRGSRKRNKKSKKEKRERREREQWGREQREREQRERAEQARMEQEQIELDQAERERAARKLAKEERNQARKESEKLQRAVPKKKKGDKEGPDLLVMGEAVEKFINETDMEPIERIEALLHFRTIALGFIDPTIEESKYIPHDVETRRGLNRSVIKKSNQTPEEWARYRSKPPQRFINRHRRRVTNRVLKSHPKLEGSKLEKAVEKALKTKLANWVNIAREHERQALSSRSKLDAEFQRACHLAEVEAARVLGIDTNTRRPIGEAEQMRQEEEALCAQRIRELEESAAANGYVHDLEYEDDEDRDDFTNYNFSYTPVDEQRRAMEERAMRRSSSTSIETPNSSRPTRSRSLSRTNSMHDLDMLDASMDDTSTLPSLMEKDEQMTGTTVVHESVEIIVLDSD